MNIQNINLGRFYYSPPNCRRILNAEEAYAVHSVGYDKMIIPSLAITINVIEECTEVPLGCPKITPRIDKTNAVISRFESSQSHYQLNRKRRYLTRTTAVNDLV
ncbi:hypothetical protein GQX74_015195 [Glossina fuscipes]|nr:hypothetical protein GQX74_015195 [Glossina fuscipes]